MAESKEVKPHIPHVLFFCKWYPHRKDPQLGVFVYKHAKALSQFCYVSCIYVKGESDNDALYHIIEKEEGALLNVSCIYRKSPFLLINAWRYVSATRKAYAEVLKNRAKPDLLNFYILLRAAVAARIFLPHIPFIVTEQWSGYLTGAVQREMFLKRLLRERFLKKAHAVVAVSGALASAIEKISGNNKTVILPNVVESVGIEESKSSASLKNILVVADLVDGIKNISGVIRALAVARKEGLELNLTILGGGEDEEFLKKLVAEERMNDHVKFLGRRDNRFVYEAMRDADAVVVNSYVETFSVVCVEAMALGKPVIATRCGGPQEIVTNESGILIEPGNDRQLVDALHYLALNISSFDPVEMNCIARQKYSYESVGAAFYNVVEQVLPG